MWKRIVIGAVVLGMARVAGAMFAMPEQVPVERLEKNIKAYVKAHPKAADGYYTLGRVNYLAAATRSRSIGVFRNGAGKSLPSVAQEVFQHDHKEAGKAVTKAELVDYVQAAVENFRKAIDLDENNALYHLS